MAQRIADRFETLLAIEALQGRDRSFAESLFAFYKENKRLTTGRRQWLTNLEQKYTPESIAKRAAEVAARATDPLNRRLQALLDNAAVEGSTREFITENKRDRLRIVADYYLPTGYFHDLAEKALRDDTFIPTEKQYNAITGNKYAQKVLAAAFDTPKFAVGSTVLVRSNAPLSYNQVAAKNVPALVIANEGRVKSAARGAKPYTILPFGQTEPIHLEERHLKKFRGKK